jgi:hypothetical protein
MLCAISATAMDDLMVGVPSDGGVTTKEILSVRFAQLESAEAA